MERYCYALIALFFFTSPSFAGWKPSDFKALSGWEQDDHAAALKAFQTSCQKRPRPKAGLKLDLSRWQKICDQAQRTRNAKAFFEKKFRPFKHQEFGLFTGYYEPILKASRQKSARYRYPIYPVPADFKSPYKTRAEITAGKIKATPIFWAEDDVALFFLHVQGSGKLQLENGETVGIGFAAKNGQKYYSIGRHMIESGKMKKEEVTAESLKNYLYQHPEEKQAIFNQNPSYIFFREIPAKGAIGAAGVVLTSERSLAVDKAHIPFGLPLWVETSLNKSKNLPAESYHRLMIAHDTGSAIKGPVRGDIFFGSGDYASERAAHQNKEGTYYLLLPR